MSTSAVSGVDGKFWEFLKFFHATNHQWSSEIVAINNDAWKKIRSEHQKVIVELTKKLEPEFWDSAFQADKDSSKKMIDSGMTRVAISEAMTAELRKRTAHLLADFMKRVPSSAGTDQGLSRRNEAGMTHGQENPNAGAPPLLRPLLDGIDRLSRLDGWLGAGCLVTLTGTHAGRSAACALCRTSFPGCRPISPWPGNTAPT